MRKVCVPTTLTRYHDDLALDAVSERCTLSSLVAKVQPIQVSPCQAGLAGQRLSVSTRFLLYQHALVPFGFRRQVGRLTQKSSLPNFSFLQKGSINGLSGAHHRHSAPVSPLVCLFLSRGSLLEWLAPFHARLHWQVKD